MLYTTFKRSLTLVLFAGVIAPAPVWAEQEMVTFAECSYAKEAMHNSSGLCSVCGSKLTESTQAVEVLGGRYEFDDVKQAYCPVCQVTMLNLENTPSTARFIRALKRRVPAARAGVVSTPTAFGLALKSTARLQFIRSIAGMRKHDGTMYLLVE